MALAVIGTEVAALNLKPKATHVAKTHHAHPVKEVNPLQLRMKKALQKIAKAGPSGPEPMAAKVITLVAFVSSLAMKFFPMAYNTWFPTLIPGYTPTKGAEAAYTFLGKPDKMEQYFQYVMYAGILFDIAGIVINFTYEGSAKSGKNGNANDLASWGNQNFWAVISFVLLPGIDSIVSTFIKGSTLAPAPDGIVSSGDADVGNFGAARGSLLNLFSMTGLKNSWAFIVHEMITLAVVGLGYALTYSQSLVFTQHGWNAGTVPLFWAFMGIGLTTGWYMLDAGAVFPEMALALTKNSDSGNFLVEIMTLLVPVSVFVIELMPIIFPDVLGTYQLVSLYLGIAFYESWASMRPYGVPDSTSTNANWLRYIKGDNTLATGPNALYTTSWLPWSASTFEKVMSGVTIFGASFAGIMFLYLFFFDSPILV